MSRAIADVEALAGLVGTALGSSEWLKVEQETIDAFAELTGDRQWIHTDVERAKGGPFGGTVAHGYLTLSLLPRLVASVYRVEGVAATVNYGLERVRFPAPLPAGSRVRATVDLLAVEPRGEATRVATRATVACEGLDRPVLVAEPITLLRPARSPS